MSYGRDHKRGNVLRIIICGCAATSPDALFLLRNRGVPLDWWFYRFHEGIQWYEHPSGGLVELCFMIGMSLLILRHFKTRPTEVTMRSKANDKKPQVAAREQMLVA